MGERYLRPTDHAVRFDHQNDKTFGWPIWGAVNVSTVGNKVTKTASEDITVENNSCCSESQECPSLKFWKYCRDERQFWWTKSALGDYEYELKILCGSFVLNVFMIAVIYLFILFCQPQVMGIMLQVCHANPGERARFIRCIYNLLNSSSPAVRYEAAGTLVTLSSAPTAIRVSNSGWNGFLVGCCFCYWVTWLSLVGSWVFNSQEIHAQQRGSLPSLLVGVCSVDSFFSL